MLEVREQSTLSWKKLVHICRLSIAHRILRSMVTIAIIALAIAFLSSIVLQGAIGRSVLSALERDYFQITAHRELIRLLQPFASPEELVEFIAGNRDDPAQSANIQDWGEISATEWEFLADWSMRARQEFQQLEQIPVGRRIQFFDDQSGIAALKILQNSDAADVENVRQLQSARQLAAEWPEAEPLLDRILSGHRVATERFADGIGSTDVAADLGRRLDSDPSARSKTFQSLADAGFRHTDAAMSAILAGAAYESNLFQAFEMLRVPEIRNQYFATFQNDYDPRAILLLAAKSDQILDWIIEQADRSEGGDVKLDRETFERTAEEFALRERILALRTQLSARFGSVGAAESRTIWLVVVSCLVCVVGIANAMLMSVLERFKEIATMKCLGARNETIRFLFIAESLAMGLCGGVCGVLIAGLIVIPTGVVLYGHWLLASFPMGPVATIFFGGLVFSILIAGVAALYPAHVASKMAPLEAMRVD